MARHVEVDPGLWEQFHRVVNMSSRELQEWLRTRSAGEDTEVLPDEAGTETGRRVLRVLQKRRVDIDENDENTMRKVVDRVHAERSDELEPTAGQDNWRHRLMTIGHDPLKETR
jgi:hypothetical protein